MSWPLGKDGKLLEEDEGNMGENDAIDGFQENEWIENWRGLEFCSCACCDRVISLCHSVLDEFWKYVLIFAGFFRIVIDVCKG